MSPISKALQHLTKAEAVTLLDLVQHTALCDSRAAFDRTVEDLKNLVPFEYFTCLQSHIEGGEVRGPFRVVNVNYDPEWVGIYTERNYHLIDPVLKENFRSYSVQYWADTYRMSPPDREFVGAAGHFGLKSGYTSGVRSIAGTRGGLFSFAGRDMKKSSRTAVILDVITPHLYMAVDRMGSADRLKTAPVLSDREKEVLRWTTHGKTTWETAAILDISERTVKFHVKNIMRKLNAVSRAHASAVASELGLVEPD